MKLNFFRLWQNQQLFFKKVHQEFEISYVNLDTLFVFKANLSHRSLTNVLSCRISFLLEFQKLQSDSESKMHGGIPLGFGMYNRGCQIDDTVSQRVI